MVRACFYSSLSLCFREVGRNFSLSASLKRRRFRSRGGGGGGLLLSLSPSLLRCVVLLYETAVLYLHIALFNRRSRDTRSLSHLPTVDVLRDLSRPNAVIKRFKTHTYRQCHSISHGRCSNFFAGTTLTFCTSRFVLFRMSNASSPTLGPFLFPLFFVSSFISSVFDDVDGPA